MTTRHNRSDRCQEDFIGYFQHNIGTKTECWCAIPFDCLQNVKAKLTKQFKVTGIPKLVLFDGKHGDIITTNGRSYLTDDPEGLNFPWYPTPMNHLLEGKLVTRSGDQQGNEILKNKILLLFFSAKWCPPCKTFTPKLCDVYEKWQYDAKLSNKSDVEVIFVSSDRSEESYDEYCATMPWPSLSYQDSNGKRGEELRKLCDVQGIPCLAVLSENREIITTNGFLHLLKDPLGAYFPWHKQHVEELDAITSVYLNEMACLIYFTDSEEQVTHAKSVLRNPAECYQKEYKKKVNSDQELLQLSFLYEGKEGHQIASYIKSFTNLPDCYPLLALIDVIESRVYIHQTDEEITEYMVHTIVDKIKNNSLEFKKINLNNLSGGFKFGNSL